MAESHSDPTNSTVSGSVLVAGNARGPLLVSDIGISFWGGIDLQNGNIIDEHHPLKGSNVSGKVLVIPSGRGSCSGSGALLELVLNNCAPAALIFTETEDILTLGVLVAQAMFERSLPVLRINTTDVDRLKTGAQVKIQGADVYLESDPPTSVETVVDTVVSERTVNTSDDASNTQAVNISLSPLDKQMLDGQMGDAAKMAMQIILQIAQIQGADKLIDVSQAHIDACVYHGSSSLAFAQQLVSRGAKVRIPTTLNAISIDERRWQEQGIDANLGKPASQLGQAFVQMGARPSFTCAPYLLNSAPGFGEQIVWAESNAVMYANSVIGARTQKYPDFLDIFIALTGRAPASGSHMASGRNPTVCIQVEKVHAPDDAFWPLLGYNIGLVAANDLPIIYGLEALEPTMDDLKAFSAAFATTSSSSMFHMHAVTPEATAADNFCRKTGLFDNSKQVTTDALLDSYRELNTATTNKVDMICLGNPHFSITECKRLAQLCDGKTIHSDVQLVITLGRSVLEAVNQHGLVKRLESFGVEFITDTCWCMITEPVIPLSARNLMTNSGKYAHYGPALVQREMHFGSLSDCVNAACSGVYNLVDPPWLA